MQRLSAYQPSTNEPDGAPTGTARRLFNTCAQSRCRAASCLGGHGVASTWRFAWRSCGCRTLSHLSTPRPPSGVLAGSQSNGPVPSRCPRLASRRVPAQLRCQRRRQGRCLCLPDAASQRLHPAAFTCSNSGHATGDVESDKCREERLSPLQHGGAFVRAHEQPGLHGAEHSPRRNTCRGRSV